MNIMNIGLTYIFGVGLTLSKKILKQTSISEDTKIKDLTETETIKLRDVIEKSMKVEGDLRRMVMLNIKRLKDAGSYRGSRHSKHLPVRGQRTKTNSRTVRGNKRLTVGSGRIGAATKT